jgi:phage-related protein
VVSAAWNAVKTVTTSIWNGIKTAVKNASRRPHGHRARHQGAITGVFSGAAGWLLGAGKKIISGLIDGIKAP